jgi:hypothetical protein
MEETKWLQPSVSVSRIGDSASVQAVIGTRSGRQSRPLGGGVSIFADFGIDPQNRSHRGNRTHTLFTLRKFIRRERFR